MALKRINRELRDLGELESATFSAGPIGDDMFKWQGQLMGPEGTPYEGGVFMLDITFPQDFPYKPPEVKFTTKVYHCNVNDKGGICMEMLKDKWSPLIKISEVLMAIASLLAQPEADHALVPEIASLLISNKEEHDKTAAEWTRKFAQ